MIISIGKLISGQDKLDTMKNISKILTRAAVLIISLWCCTGLQLSAQSSSAYDTLNTGSNIKLVVKHNTTRVVRFQMDYSDGFSYTYNPKQGDILEYSREETSVAIIKVYRERELNYIFRFGLGKVNSHWCNVITDISAQSDYDDFDYSGYYVNYSSGKKNSEGNVLIKDHPLECHLIGMWQGYGHMTDVVDTLYFDIPYPYKYIGVVVPHECGRAPQHPQYGLYYSFEKDGKTLKYVYEYYKECLTFDFQREFKYVLFDGRSIPDLTEIEKGIRYRIPYKGMLVDYYDDGSVKSVGEILYESSPEMDDYREVGDWKKYNKGNTSRPFGVDYTVKNGKLKTFTYYLDDVPIIRYIIKDKGYEKIFNIRPKETSTKTDKAMFIGDRVFVGNNGKVKQQGKATL